MENSAEETNASVGYGPNNPEPLSLKESNLPVEKDALHSATEYIEGKNTVPDVNPSEKIVNRTEP